MRVLMTVYHISSLVATVGAILGSDCGCTYCAWLLRVLLHHHSKDHERGGHCGGVCIKTYVTHMHTSVVSVAQQPPCRLT